MSGPVLLPGLVRARRWNGYSQARLAEESGVSVYRIRRAENGREVSRNEAQALADTVGAPLARLAGWTSTTRAKRHPEFGYSLNRNGAVLHKVRAAFLAWEAGAVRAVEADWVCGGHRYTNVALTDDATGVAWCPHCDIAGVQSSPQVVYAGLSAEGLLKIGCTKSLSTRLSAQRLTLVAQAPGQFIHEGDLIRRLGQPAKGREWFRWDAGSALLVTGWMVSRRNAVAA